MHPELLLAILPLISVVVVAFDAGGECNRTAELETGTIILAQASISAGAEFIDRVVVSSLRECYTACCKSRACNTGIYKSKSPNLCFMFNCTPATRCSYASQDDYYTITLSDSSSGRTSESLTGSLESFAPQVTQLGASCDEHQTCAVEHSVCSNGLCVCQRGWVRRGTACVPFVCQSTEFQFQCNDSITCIAIYDRCNGIIECPDGSDESNCPTAGPQAEPNKSLKPLTIDLNTDLANHTRSPDSQHQSLFTLNPVAHRRDQSKVRTHLSRRLTDADELLSLPYASSSNRYRQRSNDINLDHPVPVHERFTTRRREGYINPRSVLAPSSTGGGGDWYAPENEWDLNGEDQIQEFEPVRHYPTRLVANSRRESLYSRDSSAHRDVPHRKVHKPWTHRDYWAAPPVLTDVSRNDAYDNPDVDFRMGSYPSVSMREELVDPSIFKQAPSTAWERSDAVHGRRGHLPPGRTHSISEETNMRAASHGASEDDHQTRNSEPSSTAAPNVNPAPAHTDDVLSVLQHSQSEGHTAAMILAFSLGLVCCFIALLIVEWRRRHRLHGWGAMRRRPKNVSVLFAERRKTPAAPVRRSQQQRRTKSFRDPGGFVAAEDEQDEEQKMMLQDGLVL